MASGLPKQALKALWTLQNRTNMASEAPKQAKMVIYSAFCRRMICWHIHGHNFTYFSLHIQVEPENILWLYEFDRWTKTRQVPTVLVKLSFTIGKQMTPLEIIVGCLQNGSRPPLVHEIENAFGGMMPIETLTKYYKDIQTLSRKLNLDEVSSMAYHQQLQRWWCHKGLWTTKKETGGIT